MLRKEGGRDSKALAFVTCSNLSRVLPQKSVMSASQVGMNSFFSLS